MTRAIILAAGRGSEWGLTADQPKCFTELHGKRLLDLQLEALRGASADEIAIVRGYSAESFTEPVHYFDNPRWQQTNMVMSLATASSWLEDSDCIVSYSDIFYSSETVRALEADTYSIAISYDPNWLEIWSRRSDDPLSDAETFRSNSDGSLAEIGERPSSLESVKGQFMGLIKTRPAGWRQIETLIAEYGSAADKLDMTSLLRLGLQRGWPIGTVPVIGAWGEVDVESDLAAYSQLA